MAVTKAQADQSTTAKDETGANESGPATTVDPPRTTRLDDDVSMPSVVAPGDGPYDTTDPTERATSVSPDKATAARAGFGTVNAVVPMPEPEKVEEPEQEERIERYQQLGPDGKLVTVEHDVNKGTTKLV